jgi:hypothetical protein
MLVQIYEVRAPEEAVALARLGVDHVGVLVGDGVFPCELPADSARAIFAALPPGTRRVALSLSADPAEIARIVEQTRPDITATASINIFLRKSGPKPDPSLRDHRNRQRELALQTPRLSATPACPGGQTGTSHARRSVAREGTARRARDPPVRYWDKPAPRAGEGSFLHADPGSRLLAV